MSHLVLYFTGVVLLASVAMLQGFVSYRVFGSGKESLEPHLAEFAVVFVIATLVSDTHVASWIVGAMFVGIVIASVMRFGKRKLDENVANGSMNPPHAASSPYPVPTDAYRPGDLVNTSV